jgi:flagellar basal body-associated protein FliL
MSWLSICILIASVFLAMVWYVNRSRGGETRTPEQARPEVTPYTLGVPPIRRKEL